MIGNLTSKSRVFISITALLCLTACTSDTDSENIKTQGIGANIEATAVGNGTTEIRVALYVGDKSSGTVLNLSGSDSLTVEANGIVKSLGKIEDIFGDISYEATFDFDDAGSLFKISFIRDDGTSATNSTVTLPDAVDFVLPTTNKVFRNGDEISITWQPSGISSTVQLSFNTLCPQSGGGSSFIYSERDIADTGTFTINSSVIIGETAVDVTPGNACTTSIGIARQQAGSLDSNFGEGGSIIGEQLRSRNISIEI